MRINLIIGFLLLTGVSSLFAQQTVKFGHINTEEVFMALPEVKAVQTQLEAEYKKQEANLTTMQEELKKLNADYVAIAKTLSEQERMTKEAELMEMNQRIQSFYTSAQQQLQAKEQELKAPILLKIKNAIEQVGNENGFLYIFELNTGFTVYKSIKSVDVAPLVKTKLGII